MDLAENYTEVTEERKIKNGSPYNHLFPKSKLEVTIIKRNAKLEDTIKFLPKAINTTLKQTTLIIRRLINELPVYSHYAICKRVWEWVFDHIRYRKDAPGKEQIQSPQYTWAVKSGDCDDFTVLISSMLKHIKALRVILRVSMYDEDNGYQHIYPVVVLPDGTKIVMDCVAKKFNYEAPYIQKIDKPMELQFLNGIPENRKANKSIDAEDLLDGSDDDMGELGKKGKAKEAQKGKAQNFKQKGKAGMQKAKAGIQKAKNSNVVKTLKKGFHAVNKVNPITATLRAGILIAMKTNVLKVAEQLRFAYLTSAQAQQKNFDMNKWQRLVGVNNRLAKIFYGAGGKEENYKAAILTGKGNRNKEVSLSGLSIIDLNDYNESHSIQQILGIHAYNSEIGEVEGLGEIGVVTESALASAMTVITAIAGVLKSIGSLRKDKKDKKKNDKETDSSTESNNNSDNSGNNSNASGENNNSTSDNSEKNKNENNTDSNNTEKNSDNASGSNTRQNVDNSGGENDGSNTDTPAAANNTNTGSKTSTNTSDSGSTTESTGETSTGSDNTSDTQGKGDENEMPASNAKGMAKTSPATDSAFDKFMTWAKANPLQATGVGIVSVVVVSGIAYGLYLAFRPKGKDKEKSSGMSGLPQKKRKALRYSAPYKSEKIKIHRLK